MGLGRQLKPCGTEAAYRRHRRNGEIPCAECKAAEAEARFRRGANSKMTPSRTQPCSRCSEPMWKTKGTAPEGSAMCRPCRSALRAENRDCMECGVVIPRASRQNRCGSCRHKRAVKAAALADRLCSVCGKPAIARLLCSTHYAKAHRNEHGSDHSGGRSDWIGRPARLAIYERDGWTCQICHDPVRQEFEWTPDSPTLDHIIPRTLGGSHDPDNLRTACWQCNTRRGNRVEEPDLALTSIE